MFILFLRCIHQMFTYDFVQNPDLLNLGVSYDLQQVAVSEPPKLAHPKRFLAGNVHYGFNIRKFANYTTTKTHLHLLKLLRWLYIIVLTLKWPDA